MANPTLANDATTKSYVDANTFSVSLLSTYIRTGTIKVGNIGNYNIGSAVVTGTFTSGNKAVYQGGNLMTVTYANAGYTPIISVTWYDPTTASSSINDIAVIALNSISASTATFYIEPTSSVTNNGTLYITMCNPNLV